MQTCTRSLHGARAIRAASCGSKMADLPRYRTGDQIKAHVLDLDYRMGQRITTASQRSLGDYPVKVSVRIAANFATSRLTPGLMMEGPASQAALSPEARRSIDSGRVTSSTSVAFFLCCPLSSA